MLEPPVCPLTLSIGCVGKDLGGLGVLVPGKRGGGGGHLNSSIPVDLL